MLLSKNHPLIKLLCMHTVPTFMSVHSS